MIIGVHFTIAKGFTYAAKTVLAMGGDTFQFFCRNPRGSKIKQYDDKDLESFHQIRKVSGMGPVMAHAPYTINLASDKADIRRFSCDAVTEDIIRMDRVGIEYLNLHPGSYVSSDLTSGIRRISDNLNQAIDHSSKIMVLLETMSGKGTEIGYRFEQLKAVMEQIEAKDRVGVCMDLCHVFASGYDIVNHFDLVLKEFDECIGLEHLKAVHLNDSVYGLGERKDRHLPVGEGKIGMKATLNILNHKSMRLLPFYLETPLDDSGHQNEINTIRHLADEG